MMRKKVLIIEDDRELLSIYKIRLEQAGFNVFTAQDGQAGLKKALENEPDLIMVDLMMPEIDGKDFLSIQSITKKIKDTPVFVVSNISPDVANLKELGRNIAGYLVKVEYTPKQIAQKVQQYLLNQQTHV
jgi:DNA-binding response OmpR family regulator